MTSMTTSPWSPARSGSSCELPWPSSSAAHQAKQRADIAVPPCSTQEGYSFDDDEAKAAVKLLDKNNDGCAGRVVNCMLCLLCSADVEVSCPNLRRLISFEEFVEWSQSKVSFRHQWCNIEHAHQLSRAALLNALHACVSQLDPAKAPEPLKA